MEIGILAGIFLFVMWVTSINKGIRQAQENDSAEREAAGLPQTTYANSSGMTLFVVFIIAMLAMLLYATLAPILHLLPQA